MNCNKFLALDPIQQSNYLGSLIHVVMSDDEIFELGQKLIDMGMVMGLFERVKIGAEAIHTPKNVKP